MSAGRFQRRCRSLLAGRSKPSVPISEPGGPCSSWVVAASGSSLRSPATTTPAVLALVVEQLGDVRADGGGFGSAAVEGVAIEDGSPQSCDTIRDAKLREWMGFMVAAVGLRVGVFAGRGHSRQDRRPLWSGGCRFKSDRWLQP
jgi:hypothetical protein